jgi:hypothetical protein
VPDQADTQGTRGLLAALILIGVLWVGALIAYRPSDPPHGDLPPNLFSSARALAMLTAVLGDSTPHPMGSAANAAVRDRILGTLHQMGYEPELQTDVFVCDTYGACGAPENIVLRIPGTQEDSGNILLAAHYDSVPAGPGASDDGTGVAALLEIARILAAGPRARHPIVLLIDDGEEAGLLGAQAFAEHHRWAKQTKAAINIDNRGTSGISLMFETGSANRWLMQLFARSIALPHTNSVYYAVYKLLPNDTDFTVFKKAGFQGFNFAYLGDVANYHTPQDNLKNVSVASLQQHGDNALAMLRALDQSDIGSPPAGEAVYFDLFGRSVVAFALEIVLPAAIVTLALVLLAVWLLIRRTVILLRELVWSLLGLLVAYLAAAALAVGLIYLVRAVNADGMPLFTASAWVLHATCVAASAAVLGALSLALSGRVRFWSFWGANAVWSASLALLLAIKLPGGSYLWLLPADAALLALLLRLWVQNEARVLAEFATLGFLLVMFGLLFPILIFIYAGLGRPALLLLMLLPVIGAAPLVGLILPAGSRMPRLITVVAVIAMLLGATRAAMMPAYSVQSPQPLNVHYIEDTTGTGGAARASWLLTQAAHSLAPQFRQHLVFNTPPVTVFNPLLPGGRSQFAADAPLLGLAAPTLSVTSVVAASQATNEPARVRYQIHIAPQATVSELRIALAPQAQVKSVTLTGRPQGLPAFQPVTTEPVDWGQHWGAVYVVNPPAAGLDLSFEASGVPFDIDLLNVTYGLPAAGADLRAARPADATASQGGDDTLVATTVHIPKLPQP